MKNEKGVTLISLTVYIIVMAIVVGIVAIISTFFYKNVKNVSQTVDPITEYTKFNSFFTEEINNGDIRILECGNDYIVFDNGIQYTFIEANKGIYRDKVKICRGIDKCTFENKIQNGKNIIEVKFEAKNEKKTTTYTLNN
ncbi:MAG: prepilin-type N-terminal cleavage/methylation domain-containing protein [Clostridia bacterium]|nr:prepilin-type N-terminal cleavage/methylation domain-containing protein [Clostridia bacterium]